MATYVISDIHGEYDKFLELLKMIKFKETDTLYVLGDILDRGPHPIKVLKKLMEMPNVICIVGNHEIMALECLEFLSKEITDASLEELDKDMEDYSLHDLVWARADYDTQYFDDVYVISGHTPTQTIKENPNPGFIYKNNNHIAIDCGAHYPGGRLAAICLDTMEEFYTGTNTK